MNAPYVNAMGGKAGAGFYLEVIEGGVVIYFQSAASVRRYQEVKDRDLPFTPEDVQRLPRQETPITIRAESIPAEHIPTARELAAYVSRVSKTLSEDSQVNILSEAVIEVVLLHPASLEHFLQLIRSRQTKAMAYDKSKRHGDDTSGEVQKDKNVEMTDEEPGEHKRKHKKTGDEIPRP